MTGKEIEVLNRFITHLAKDEEANGSDELAVLLEKTAKLLPFLTVEETAEQVFDLYFNHTVNLLDRWEERKGGGSK
jgi:hypothetical protein